MNPLSAIFTAQEVIDTGRKTRKNMKDQLNSGTNKYDLLLNNKVVKAPTSGGEINAVNVNPLFRSASEEIDFLHKVANDGNTYNFHHNRNRKKMYHGKPRNDFEKEKSNLKVIPENDEKLEFNPYLVAGGSILGAAAIQALTSKNLTAPLSSMKNGVKDFAYRLPRKTLGKKKPIGRAMDVLKMSVKPLYKEDRIHMNKTSTWIDHEYEKIATMNSFTKKFEKINNSPKAQKIKGVLRDDFIRTGIETIPYYTAPAALGYFAGKNISHPEDDPGVQRVIVEVPLENFPKKTNKKTPKKALYQATNLEKQAIRNDMSWSEWATNELPRKAVQGLGRTVFPAAVIGLTGRNIKGRLERLEKKDSNQNSDLKNGTARIIIETKPPKAEKKRIGRVR